MRVFFRHILIAATLCSLVSGCAFHRRHTYEVLKWQVDKEGVLQVKAFPADYPNWDFHIPFVLLISDGAKEFNFQLYLYLRRQKAPEGISDKDIKSCTITEFSYQPPGSERVHLIDDNNPWDGHYWAVHRLKGKKPAPVPYLKGESMDVRVRLELNGKAHIFEGKTKASSRMGLPCPLLWVYSSI